MRLLSSLLFVTVALTPAQQLPGALTFTATLDSIKINARPGQVVTRQFRLTLDPEQPLTQFKVHVEDWWRSEDGKQSFYAEPGTLARSCGKWVSVNPVESAIRGRETLVVRVTVTAPAELRSGGYWCALTVDQVPNPLAESAAVGVRFVASVSTGIFVYLDPIDRAASIADLQVGPDEAFVKVRNEGNTPLAVEGRVDFRRPASELPVTTITIPRSTILTEPISTGVVSAKLPPQEVLPAGRYIMRAILDFGADHYIGAEREVEVTRVGPTNAPLR